MTDSGPSATDVRCSKCGYNLTGVAIGGACPECGTPVAPSFQSALAPTSGKAIAAMVLGICSIVTCMCYGVPGLVCGLLALIFARQAREQIATGQYSDSSQGMAKAGMICGIIGLVLSLLFFLYIVGVIVFAILHG